MVSAGEVGAGEGGFGWCESLFFRSWASISTTRCSARTMAWSGVPQAAPPSGILKLADSWTHSPVLLAYAGSADRRNKESFSAQGAVSQARRIGLMSTRRLDGTLVIHLFDRTRIPGIC